MFPLFYSDIPLLDAKMVVVVLALSAIALW